MWRGGAGGRLGEGREEKGEISGRKRMKGEWKGGKNRDEGQEGEKRTGRKAI